MDAETIAALEDAMAVPFERTNGKRPTAREILAQLEQQGFSVQRTGHARPATNIPATPAAVAAGGPSARTLMSSLDERIEEARSTARSGAVSPAEERRAG